MGKIKYKGKLISELPPVADPLPPLPAKKKGYVPLSQEEISSLADGFTLQLPSHYLREPQAHHKLTDEVALKLEYAFKKGHTTKSACNYAGVKYDTYARWLNRYPLFKLHMDMAKEYLKDKALGAISYHIEMKDVETSKWYLERKYSKEFGKTPDVLQQFNNYKVDFVETDDDDMKEEDGEKLD